MTEQVDLGLVWAKSGGFTAILPSRYENGWVSEIPTYQDFNYILQGIDKNILHYAEKNSFDWKDDINYAVGGKALRNGVIYRCTVAHINADPDLDITNSYWVTGDSIGTNHTGLLQSDGLRVKMPNNPSTQYQGSDITVYNTYPMIELRTNSGAVGNLGVRNTNGELTVCNLGTSGPDGRNLTIAGGNNKRLFHEGHLPTVAECLGAVPEAPTTGKAYARKGITSVSGSWVEVTSTTVSISPPPPSVGAGQGWYSLDDGQFYIDINDGDSSQWVHANPPVIPEVTYTGAYTAELGNTIDEAIDALYALIQANHP